MRQDDHFWGHLQGKGAIQSTKSTKDGGVWAKIGNKTAHIGVELSYDRAHTDDVINLNICLNGKGGALTLFSGSMDEFLVWAGEIERQRQEGQG